MWRTIPRLALAALLLAAGGCAAASPVREGTSATVLPGGAVGFPVTPVPPVARVRLASQLTATDVGHFVALERGYFAQEALDVELIPFTNASEMVPAVATNQVEVGGLAGNPAMWNAVARGVHLKMLLDKGSARLGNRGTGLVVRKDVYEAGRGRRLDDLRGLRLAFTPPGLATVHAMPLDVAMQRVGASIDDLTIESLPFPDQIAALANRSVDGAMITEPFLSRALKDGAVLVMGLDEMYPDYTVGVVAFSPSFYDDRAVAKRFVRGYVRGTRAYNDAVAGRTDVTDRAAIDEIVAKHTRIDVAAVREMAPIGLHPNGRLNVESLRHSYRWFRERGFIPEPIAEAALEALWGVELVDEVLGEIGRVPE